jgi:capsular polysaccharide biosynthesis protein
MLLQRSDGNGLRKWLNKNSVEKAIQEVFQTADLTTVFIDAQTPVQEQIRLFCSFHVIISSHSSQMANLMFSTPGISVVEFQGKGAKLEPTFMDLGHKAGCVCDLE